MPEKLKLTDRVIAETPPGPKDLVIWDTVVHGLFVKITPAGNRVFGFYYRLANREHRPKLGNYPKMTLDEAREWGREMAEMVERKRTEIADAEKAERRKKLGLE